MKKISIIIISYNRAADALELLKNLVQLDQSDKLVSEIILVNNQSTEDYTPIENYIQQINHVSVIYKIASENLGVARGRNFALQFARGEYCIFLDDDALLAPQDALIQLCKLFERPTTSEREIAIISFKVIYYATGNMQRNALPHKKFNKYKDLPYFETYYFAGGAHAIKKSALNVVGNLSSDFFYGMEEYDLSYRLIEAGYAIQYNNAIHMLHKESPQGRNPKAIQLQMMWVNKTIVAWRYLPIRYVLSTAIMWSMEYLIKTKFNILGFLKGWFAILQIPKKQKRNRLSPQSLLYLKSVEARLWY